MKTKYLSILIVAFAISLTSCDNSEAKRTDLLEGEVQVQDEVQRVIYEAEITALNSEVTGLQTHGSARFVIEGDEMEVTIDIQNAPAGIEHWQHFHGFIETKNATCASLEQDANGDGIVDVVETETVSGTTMVPFNGLPEKMNLPDNSYPVADKNGAYHYQATIPMGKLKTTFSNAFEGSEINLNSRVLYIHGVPENTKLPATVQSVHDIPAHVTLPIACGKIMKISE